MDLITLLFIGFFYLCILITGFWAGKKAKQLESSKGISGMILGGRKLPLWIGAMTMTATWVGGGYINGTAEAVFTNGLVWAQAPWGYSLSLIIGGLFFARRMHKDGHTTLLDPFEKKYGKSFSSLLFLPALIGDIFWTSAILTALGYTFSALIGLDFTTSIIISASVAIAYTFMGGLWAVAYTDVIQLGLIFFGLLLAVPYALERAGGLSVVYSNYTHAFGNAASILPPIEAWESLNLSFTSGVWQGQIWQWLDLAMLLVLGGIPWGVYFQRVLACPSPKTAQRLSFMAGIGCLLMAIPPILIGMIGVKINWLNILPEASVNGAMILPYVLKYLTPYWVSIIGLAAIASAVMSSIDSSILSSASMFTWNIYKPWFPHKGTRQLLMVTKIAILLMGIGATFLALRVRSVYTLWYLCADLVYVLLFPQLVMVLYFKGSNKIGAMTGFVVGLFIRLVGGEPSLGMHGVLFDLFGTAHIAPYFPIKTAAMLASLLSIYLASLLASKGGLLREAQKIASSAQQ